MAIQIGTGGVKFMSLTAMILLGVAYVVITILCLIEGKRLDALYWVGALLITMSLILRR